MTLGVRHDSGSQVVIKETCSEAALFICDSMGTLPFIQWKKTIFSLTVKPHITDIIVFLFFLDFRGLCCRRQSVCKEL